MKGQDIKHLALKSQAEAKVTHFSQCSFPDQWMLCIELYAAAV